MRRLRGVALLCCGLFLLLPLWGCGSGNRRTIRMDLPGPVENLDPQFATGESARMILLNLGEGLVVEGADGLIRPGAAREWTVSADELTYTFALREDACWEDGQPVTAADFVFAFRRMFSPGAASPYAREFFSIRGARAIVERRGAMSLLGVEAPDEKTVVFRLERPDSRFLQLLASSAALPCREDFFGDSRGKYGLEPKQVLSNGPFALDRWDNEQVIQLVPNEHYRKDSPQEQALPQRVVLYIGREDPLSQFLDGKSDLVLATSAQQDKVGSKADLVAMENAVWCIAFRQSGTVWGNPLLRQALALCVDETMYSGELAANRTATRSLIPPAAMLEGVSYRERAGDAAAPGFDPVQGAYLLGAGLSALELERLPQTVLLVPEEHRLDMGLVAQGWQKHLDIHINVEPAAPDVLESRLSTGDYQMMLVRLAPSGFGPDTLLEQFASGSDDNRWGWRNSRFDQALEEARSLQGREAAEQYRFAEEMILADAVVIPICFETTVYALSPQLSGVEISPFGGVIRFAGATKEAS